MDESILDVELNVNNNEKVEHFKRVYNRINSITLQ